MFFIVIPGIPNSQVILCSWALPKTFQLTRFRQLLEFPQVSEEAQSAEILICYCLYDHDEHDKHWWTMHSMFMIHTYTMLYIYIYTYIYIYVYLYIHNYTYVCVYIYMSIVSYDISWYMPWRFPGSNQTAGHFEAVPRGGQRSRRTWLSVV